MAFITTGLPNGGVTRHFSISYDDTLSRADGLGLATGLVNSCEVDFALMTGWFGGLGLEFSFPLPVQIAASKDGSTSGAWTAPTDLERFFGSSPTITLVPAPGKTLGLVRYLFVSEVTEMFMASLRTSAWFEPTGLFDGADEGSKGEALSRFLAVQFQLANGLGPTPLAGGVLTPLWLTGARPNVIDVLPPDDDNPDATTGGMTCFLYYLTSQLGFTVNEVIAAGADTMAGVYKNLTGKTDAWASFGGLIDSHYPPGVTYNPVGDNLFPVSDLSQFFAPSPISCGDGRPTLVLIDKPAMAEVTVALTSADPATVTVAAATVTVPVGAISAPVHISTAATAGPFPPKSVDLTASYAGGALTIPVQVVPPQIASFTVAPASLTAGNNAVATVTLARPSLAGPVVLSLSSLAPHYADVPAQLTIPQNQASAQFTITAPPSQIPFSPALVTIYASYGAQTASATLTVQPSVVIGTVSRVTVTPPTIRQGLISRGAVTLLRPVPSPTQVGLAAVDGGPGSGAPLPTPTPGNGSSMVASVPASITIPAGQTVGYFNITTKPELSPGTTRRVTIMAAAVTEKYAGLTITA